MPQPSTGRPSRRPQPPRRQPTRRKSQQQPIYYEEPPIRTSAPPLTGVIGALGVILLVALLMLVFFKGSGPPSPPGDGGKGGAPPPNVSIADAKKCEIITSSRINLNTPERVKDCEAAKKHAKAKLIAKGKGGEWDCLDKLWHEESKWSPWALHPTSGAWGIAQILPEMHRNPTVNGEPVKKGDWRTQVDWGLNYIDGRPDYKGSPCEAWRLWNARWPHWY